MDLTSQVDNYCERVDFAFWSEPLNAATNASFLIAALICWGMLGGKRDWPARVLTINLAVIGIGSFLFHTYATRWALLADVIPIQVFILIYLHFAATRFLGLPVWAGLGAVALYFPYAWGTGTLIAATFGPLNGSVGYIPVAILIALMALAVLPRDRTTAAGLGIGAGLLAVSLFFRTIDDSVCAVLPIGTHFLWHTLNGIMLGWMIVVLHRHQPPLAPIGAGR